MMKNKDHYEKTRDFHRISAVEKNGFYDAMFRGRPLQHTRYQLRVRRIILSILDTLLPDVPDIDRAVDVGCGRGDFTIEIARRYPQLNTVCGCDFTKEALSIAQKETPAAMNLSFQNGHLLHLPYCDNSFDLASCVNVLHHIHIEDLEKALAELARISRRYIVLEIKNINNVLYRYTHPISLPGMKVYSTSITNVSHILNKYNFELIEHHGIFLFNWLSPMVILVYSKKH